jgi:hypothetical protein
LEEAWDGGVRHREQLLEKYEIFHKGEISHANNTNLILFERFQLPTPSANQQQKPERLKGPGSQMRQDGLKVPAVEPRAAGIPAT